MKKFIVLNIILVNLLLIIILVGKCICGGIIVQGRDIWEEKKLEVMGKMYEKAEKEGRSYLTPKEEEILEKELAKIEKQQEAEEKKEFEKFYKMMTPQREEIPPPIKKIIRRETPMTKSTYKPQQIIQHKEQYKKEEIKQVKPKEEIKITQQKQEEIKTKKKSIIPFVLISLMLCVGVGMYLSLKKIK